MRPKIQVDSDYDHQLVLDEGETEPRIVGGYGGVQSDWPFMAFVLYFDANGNPEFSCSGTVVSSNVVLTAGHCAVDEASGSVAVSCQTLRSPESE